MQTKVNKNLFTGQSIYAGIDVHKKSWNVTIMGEHYEHKSFSQNPEPGILVSYLRKNFPGADYHAVYEAGFSGFNACRELKEMGVNCQVIHAADVPTSIKEKLQKTDKADSRKLARGLRGDELTPIDIPALELEVDRAIVRQRFRVMKDLTRVKNRVKSLLFQFGIDIPEGFSNPQTQHWSKVYINWLNEITFAHEGFKNTMDSHLRTGGMLRKELLLLNRQVRGLSQKPVYKKNFELLTSIPGIGLLTAMTFLVQIGNINRFARLDDLCSYVGLIPRMYGSGEKMQTGKIIKRGRKELKIMLIEAAWDAQRMDPALMASFNELIKKMPKNKAIIRIARKLLSRMRYVLQNQEYYVTCVTR
jgi:transposase